MDYETTKTIPNIPNIQQGKNKGKENKNGGRPAPAPAPAPIPVPPGTNDWIGNVIHAVTNGIRNATATATANLPPS